MNVFAILYLFDSNGNFTGLTTTNYEYAEQWCAWNDGFYTTSLNVTL